MLRKKFLDVQKLMLFLSSSVILFYSCLGPIENGLENEALEPSRIADDGVGVPTVVR